MIASFLCITTHIYDPHMNFPRLLQAAQTAVVDCGFQRGDSQRRAVSLLDQHFKIKAGNIKNNLIELTLFSDCSAVKNLSQI